jgi:hypothetical protein
METYTYSKNGVDFIMHANRKSTKYIAKIDNYYGVKKPRYFYTQNEYQSFLNNKRGTNSSSNNEEQNSDAYNEAYSNTKEKFDFAKESSDQAWEKANSFVSDVGKKVSNAYNSAQDTNNQAYNNFTGFVNDVSNMASNAASNAYDTARGTIDAGKDFFESLFK